MNFDNDATPLPIGQSRTKTKLNSSRRCCDTYYAVRPPSPRHDPPNIKCLLLRNNWHYFVKTVHCARVHFVVSYFILMFHLVHGGVFIYIVSILRLKHLSNGISVHLTLIHSQMIDTRNELRHCLSIEYYIST